MPFSVNTPLYIHNPFCVYSYIELKASLKKQKDLITKMCDHMINFKPISLLFTDHADMLTNMGRDKHFLGDYLPPEELEKFLETLEALKDGRTPDYSDYKKFKIQADNIGKYGAQILPELFFIL